MKYIKEFDTVRAIAVSMVMLAHYLPQIKVLWVFSSAGVNMFFVLSGYLITQILINEKEKHSLSHTSPRNGITSVLKTFYLRRILRIFPVFYLVLLLCILLNVDSARPFWYYHAFYASNFFYSFHEGDRLVHFWSLAVEEQFYFFWPLFILLIPKRFITTRFFLQVILVSIAIKIALIFTYTTESPVYNTFMPSCIESFALGVVALLLVKQDIRKSLIVKVCLSSLMLFLAIAAFKEIHKSGLSELLYALFTRTLFSIFSASFLLLIVKGYVTGWIRKILNNSFLQLTGKISYGIYIYHMFIPSVLLYLGKKFEFTYPKFGFLFFLEFAITFLIAWVSFFYFEKPINELKKRFSY